MLKQDPFIQPHLAAMAPHLWATFFLAVPVVSSTFASISRCFRDLGEGQIGLLLVDEAGQAVPSHALGAIWRSKRALIVGDPLQVEPFISMDSKLDRGMLTYHGAPQEHLLTDCSVQLLADRANRWGAHIVQYDGSELWVGAPLRVHRRCAEPMFSLSNAMAYNEKMVSGVSRDVEKSATTKRALLGPSRWLDFSAGIFEEHYSVTEGAAAVDIVIAYAKNGWVAKSDRLPDVFLISPFKTVAQKLTGVLSDRAHAWAGGVDQHVVSAWLKERVGTVHTFQGKECDTVVFVLGGKTPGARSWAGDQPNIINVAVTRAKRRLYVIGDRQAWSQTVFGQQLAQAVGH
jgi:superfamily I DNA and/or RNA helicase